MPIRFSPRTVGSAAARCSRTCATSGEKLVTDHPPDEGASTSLLGFLNKHYLGFVAEYFTKIIVQLRHRGLRLYFPEQSFPKEDLCGCEAMPDDLFLGGRT